MDVWVIDRGSPDWEAAALVEAFRAAGMSATFVDWDRLSIGSDGIRAVGGVVEPPEVAFIRSPITTRARPEELMVEFDRLRVLERAGTRLVNTADAIEHSSSKLRQAAALAAAGLAVPPTRVVRSAVEIEEIVAEWRTAIVKPVYGHAGVGVFALGAAEPGVVTERELIHVWHMLQQQRQIVVQPRVGSGHSYVRVCIVGARVVCQYRLSAGPGRGVPHELGSMTREAVRDEDAFGAVALAAAEALGVELTAVDLIDDDEGVVIIEVNPCLSTWEGVEGSAFDLTDHGITAEHVAHLQVVRGA